MRLIKVTTLPYLIEHSPKHLHYENMQLIIQGQVLESKNNNNFKTSKPPMSIHFTEYHYSFSYYHIHERLSKIY